MIRWARESKDFIPRLIRTPRVLFLLLFLCAGFYLCACSKDCWVTISKDKQECMFSMADIVWGSRETVLVVANDDGELVHYDGQIWSEVEHYPVSTIAGVWGSSPTNIYVSIKGGVVHFDGVNWSKTVITDLSIMGRWSVWGSSDHDVFITGLDSNGSRIVFHFDGNLWTKMDVDPGPAGVTQSSPALLGVSSKNVFLLGSLENIGVVTPYTLHYDGQTWSEYLCPICGTNSLDGVFGTSDQNIYMFSGKDLFHFDGNEWSDMGKVGYDGSPVLSGSLGNYFGFDGDKIIHFDGKKWTTIASVPGSLYQVTDMWVSTSNDIYISADKWHIDSTDMFIDCGVVLKNVCRNW